MARRQRAGFAGALLLGAAIAFPLGMIVAQRDGAKPAAGPLFSGAPAREVFSPSIDGDPWFLEGQREGVEALERQCRETGEYCAEAAQARLWLSEQRVPN